MGRLRIALGMAALLLGLASASVAAAQDGAPVRVVQGSDGSLYLLKDGTRYAIAVDGVDDDELGAYADGGTLGSDDLVAMLGGSSSPSSPGVAQPRPSAPPTVDSVDSPPPPPTTQQPAGPGLTRAGVPSLNFIKGQGAAPGGTAAVSVQSVPGATCTLAYRTPAGTPSTAAGLGQQTADANGVASWSWLIDSNTKPGLGTIAVNCGNLGVTDTIQIGSGSPAKR